MDTGYHIRIARPDDLDVVLGLIDDAADWLRALKIRIDGRTDNAELHTYYRRLGFRGVAARTTSDRTPSGALFGKPLNLTEPALHPRITECWSPLSL